MDKKRFIVEMDKIEKGYRETEKVSSQLYKIFGGSMPDCVWYAFERMMSYLGELIGDESEWISWHIYENDFGKNKMEAGCNEKMKKIRNASDLYDIIKLDCKD